MEVIRKRRGDSVKGKGNSDKRICISDTKMYSSDKGRANSDN